LLGAFAYLKTVTNVIPTEGNTIPAFTNVTLDETNATPVFT